MSYGTGTHLRPRLQDRPMRGKSLKKNNGDDNNHANNNVNVNADDHANVNAVNNAHDKKDNQQRLDKFRDVMTPAQFIISIFPRSRDFLPAKVSVYSP